MLTEKRTIEASEVTHAQLEPSRMIFTVTDLSSRNGIFIVPSDGSPVFYQNMQSSSYKLLEVEITSNNSVAAEGQMHSTGKYFVAL